MVSVPSRLIAAGLAAVIVGPAHAQSTRVLRDACFADARALCAAVQPGGGRLLVCLDRNRAKLSQPCAAALPPSDVIKARIGG